MQVVAGKGGVGRTTVAAALALRSARDGHRTLLLEVDAPDAAARVLGAAPAVDAPREVENNLWLCRMTPAGSLKEYALLVLRFKALYRLVFENELVKYLLRSIPSLAELTMLGKAWWHATQETRRDGKPRFERVIVDAPATGHAITFLSVARTVADVAPPGILKHKAEEMAADIEQAALHVVALPEEMPVNEGLDLFRAVPERLRITPGVAILNRRTPRLLRPGEEALLERIAEAPAATPYVAAARRRLDREQLEREHEARFFSGVEQPRVVLSDRPGPDRPRLEAVIEAFDRASAEGADVGEASSGEAAEIGAPAPAEAPEATSAAARRGPDRAALAEGLDPVLASARCLVCVGPGGVGKTSISAALAIEAAQRARRSVVLTIDPARRLANALGLPEIGSVETAIDPGAFRRAGLEPPPGRLTALMLDIKEAWDDVVTRYHPNPERRAELLDNRLYHALSTALAGSQEYMAMEKLHLLASREKDRPDLIVLDTPPAQHALDFLEAPNRIVDALDNDATKWLLQPKRDGSRRLSRRMFDAGSSLFIRTIARFTGIELLDELAELLAGFSEMFEGFRARARAVKALLAREDTVFCVVGYPGSSGLADVRGFVEQLRGRDLQLGAVVLNRATPPPFEGAPEDPSGLRAAVEAAGGSEDLARRLEVNAQRAEARAAEERAGAAALAAGPPALRVVLVPELRGDVHDLESLERLRAGLHPGVATRPAAV